MSSPEARDGNAQQDTPIAGLAKLRVNELLGSSLAPLIDAERSIDPPVGVRVGADRDVVRLLSSPSTVLSSPFVPPPSQLLSSSAPLSSAAAASTAPRRRMMGFGAKCVAGSLFADPGDEQQQQQQPVIHEEQKGEGAQEGALPRSRPTPTRVTSALSGSTAGVGSLANTPLQPNEEDIDASLDVSAISSPSPQVSPIVRGFASPASLSSARTTPTSGRLFAGMLSPLSGTVFTPINRDTEGRRIKVVQVGGHELCAGVQARVFTLGLCGVAARQLRTRKRVCKLASVGLLAHSVRLQHRRVRATKLFAVGCVRGVYCSTFCAPRTCFLSWLWRCIVQGAAKDACAAAAVSIQCAVVLLGSVHGACACV